MNVISVVVLVFALLGALDYLIGNKIGVGAEFVRAFSLFAPMLVVGVVLYAKNPALLERRLYDSEKELFVLGDKGLFLVKLNAYNGRVNLWLGNKTVGTNCKELFGGAVVVKNCGNSSAGFTANRGAKSVGYFLLNHNSYIIKGEV